MSSLPLIIFPFSLSRLPSRKSSETDPPVPHQDPQGLGQSSSQTHPVPAAAAAHQQLPASPELNPSAGPTWTSSYQTHARAFLWTLWFCRIIRCFSQPSCFFYVGSLMWRLLFIAPLFSVLPNLSKKTVCVRRLFF